MRRLNNFGDTIVEVMIVLAVLGFGFAISYATANRGLQSAQNSEEHSQALNHIASQVELTRVAVSDSQDVFDPAKAFCVDSNNQVVIFSGYNPGPDIPGDQFNKYPSKCVQDNRYYESIEYDSNGIFTFRVRWDGLGTFGRQQEVINYKISKVSIASDYIPIGGSAGGASSQIGVIVKKVPADPGNTTPSCGKAASENLGGSQISLQGAGSTQTGSTSGNSTATFGNLVDNNDYTASIRGSDVPTSSTPGTSYQLCYNNAPISTSDSTPRTIGSTKAIPNNPNTISSSAIKIRPICGQQAYTYWTNEPVYGWYISSYSFGGWTMGNRRGDLDGYHLTSDWGTSHVVVPDPRSGTGFTWFQWYAYSNSYPGQSWYNAWEAVAIWNPVWAYGIVGYQPTPHTGYVNVCP